MHKLLVVLVSLALAKQSFSSVELQEVNPSDRHAFVDSNVELKCGLNEFYEASVNWRKLVGVSQVNY